MESLMYVEIYELIELYVDALSIYFWALHFRIVNFFLKDAH